ncbi:cyclohexyl-isocyanide hydratase [Nitrosovibrio sp. Nv17]|jgi:cyclohexyl-isocyanide hydratase|nr:cyclohexyl-isocyanide hydratase [Nitrosovibrio sp. Nv17]
MDIRELGQHEQKAYRALWLLGITRHPAFFRISPEDDATTGIPTRFEPDSFTLGAFSGSSLMGIVSLERDSHAKLRHKALVFRMFVHPEAAGRGIGRALLERLISSANGIDSLRYLYLTVLTSNTRAIRLYSSLGFHTFAHEPGSVLIGDCYVDEFQMACRLTRA